MSPLITQKRLSKLPRPATGNKLYFDSEIPGFAVRVTAGGAISFVLSYRIHGRERRYTIGRYPILTLADAREDALELHGDIRAGRDPLDTRTSERDAPTMKDLAHDYFEFYAEKSKRASSLRNDHQMLDNVILPKLGSMRVAAITRRDVEALHASFHGTPYRANRILALLSKMFSLAVQWHAQNPVWRPDNPALGVKKYPEEKRSRWLNKKEIGSLLTILDKYPEQKTANALRLILLTGSRKGEALAAKWDDIDFKNRLWRKHSAHTKQKREEFVPLGSDAIKLLKRMQKTKDSEFLFPGRISDHPLENLKTHWSEIRKLAELPTVRIHDLRHTYASHLVSSGTPLAVVGKLLGHTQSQTTARYAHLAESPLRKATDKFGKLMSSTTKKNGSRKVAAKATQGH
jgi:integrase